MRFPASCTEHLVVLRVKRMDLVVFEGRVIGGMEVFMSAHAMANASRSVFCRFILRGYRTKICMKTFLSKSGSIITARYLGLFKSWKKNIRVLGTESSYPVPYVTSDFFASCSCPCLYRLEISFSVKKPLNSHNPHTNRLLKLNFHLIEWQWSLSESRRIDISLARFF